MSLNYRDWYLLELYSQVVRTLGVEKATTLTNEVGEHFDSLVAEFTERGMDKLSAEVSSLERLGSASACAKKIIEKSVKNYFLLSVISTLGILFLLFVEQNSYFQFERLLWFSIISGLCIAKGLLTLRKIEAVNFFIALAFIVCFYSFEVFNNTAIYGDKTVNRSAISGQLTGDLKLHRQDLLTEAKMMNSWRKIEQNYLQKPFTQVQIELMKYETSNANTRQRQSWGLPNLHSQSTYLTTLQIGNYADLKNRLNRSINEVHFEQVSRVHSITVMREALKTRFTTRVLQNSGKQISSILKLALMQFGLSYLGSIIGLKFRMRRLIRIA